MQAKLTSTYTQGWIKSKTKLTTCRSNSEQPGCRKEFTKKLNCLNWNCLSKLNQETKKYSKTFRTLSRVWATSSGRNLTSCLPSMLICLNETISIRQVQNKLKSVERDKSRKYSTTWRVCSSGTSTFGKAYQEYLKFGLSSTILLKTKSTLTWSRSCWNLSPTKLQLFTKYC